MEQDGSTQTRIAESPGVSDATVSQRLRLNRGTHLHETVLIGNLDESHCREILAVFYSTKNLDDWLTAEQAQLELVSERSKRDRWSSLPVYSVYVYETS